MSRHQSFLNRTTNNLDDDEKLKSKISYVFDESSNLHPPSAKLVKLNQEKSTLVSLINNKNSSNNNTKNYNQFGTKKKSFDGHLERNQLNSIEISNGKNIAFTPHSNHCQTLGDRFFTNSNLKESQKQQHQHSASSISNITVAAYRKYPLTSASFISFKNPINNLKTFKNFLQDEDVDENDDDIIEITPIPKNYNLPKINSTSISSNSNDNYHYLQNNVINDEKLSPNIGFNNRQQKKSVSLSPSPSSSSSSSTMSSLNLNSANGNTACLLNTIN